MYSFDLVIHSVYALIKSIFPAHISMFIKSCFTAALTPILFGVRSGYFLSCFKMAAVDKNGRPLPWYSYPCIDFLKSRSFKDKKILEFGGGQSTLWWASRAEYVVTFEADEKWVARILKLKPSNIAVHQVTTDSQPGLLEKVRRTCADNGYTPFDVVIIDGLWWRKALIPISIELLSETGVIIFDNADQVEFGVYEGFIDSGLKRVDFVGIAPGTLSQDCTSIIFGSDAFVFEAKHPIPVEWGAVSA